MLSYAHLPLIAYAQFTRPSYGIWISAILPQIGMAMPFVPVVVAILTVGASLFSPGDPFGYLTAKFPGSAGEALIGIPILILFTFAYVFALLRVFPRDRLSRGWATAVILWSVSTNALMIPLHERTGNERVAKAGADVRAIVEALRLYYADVGTYPTQPQGLAMLAEPNAKAPEGYLARVPPDPFGRAYSYRIPGVHNPDAVDVWTYGADGVPGGCGLDRDIGNWDAPEGSEQCRSSTSGALAIAAATMLLVFTGVCWRYRRL